MRKLLITICLLVVLAFGVGFFFFQSDSSDLLSTSNNQPVGWMYDGETWEAHGDVPTCDEPFKVSMPVNEELVTGMLYPGQYRGGQFKPHGGFRFDSSAPEDITVYSPADGQVRMAASYLYAEGSDVQYMIDIMTNCGIMYRFDHLHVLSSKLEKVLEHLPSPKPNDSRGHFLSEPLYVEEGEVLAEAVGFGDFNGRPNVFVDFGVYDVRQRNMVSQQASWPADDHGWSELAPYGICWLDYLVPGSLGDRLKTLPTGKEGRTSVYCT